MSVSGSESWSGLRTAVAAEILGVSPGRLRQWHEAAGFPDTRVDPAGRREFAAHEVFAMRMAQDAAFAIVADLLGNTMLDEASRLTAAPGGSGDAREPGELTPARTVHAADYTVLEWDEAAERMFGWSAAEVIGRQPAQFLLPLELRPAVREHRRRHERLRRRPRARYFEVENVDRAGRRFPVGVTVTPRLDPDDTRLDAVTRDLTVRRRITSQQPLNSLLRHSEDAIVVYDGASRITDYNAAAERLFGFPRATAVGLTSDIIIPDELFADSRLLRLKVDTGDGFAREPVKRAPREGPLLDLELTATRLRPRGPAPLIATYRAPASAGADSTADL